MKGDLTLNADGSVDLNFGPHPQEGSENNWVQTVPGKGWLAILRLYSPLEPMVRQDLAAGRNRAGLG